MKYDFLELKEWACGFVVLLLIILVIGGCASANQPPRNQPPRNQPPSITSLKAKQDVLSPLSSCLIECVASDPDGDELSYEWLTVNGDIDEEGAAVSWDAPEQEGIYNIMVKVTDNKGGEATGFVAITVKANNSPVINSLIASVNWVPPLGICNITCDAVDLDGDDLSYEWIAERGDISGTGPVVTCTAPDRVGLSNIIVVVSDGIGGEMTRSLMISVALKAPPIIERLVVTSEDAKTLKEYQWGYKILKKRSCEIECIVAGANDELVYEWSDGEDTYIEDCHCGEGPFSGEGAAIKWTAPDEGGEVTITVIVYDNEGNMASSNVVFNVETCASCMD